MSEYSALEAIRNQLQDMMKKQLDDFSGMQQVTRENLEIHRSRMLEQHQAAIDAALATTPEGPLRDTLRLQLDAWYEHLSATSQAILNQLPAAPTPG